MIRASPAILPCEVYPVQIRGRVNRAVPEYWVSVGGIAVGTYGRTRNVLGFGCDRNRDRAEAASFYECLEHAFAVYEAYDVDELEEELPIFHVNGSRSGDTVLRKDLLVGAQADGGRRNATGLAIGPDVWSAVAHARNELIERHLAWCFWFGGDLTTAIIEESRIGKSVRKLKFLHRRPEGVFVCTVLQGDDPPLILAGSCYSLIIRDAAEHADAEAYMLLDTALGLPSTSMNPTAAGTLARYEALGMPDTAGGLARRLDKLAAAAIKQPGEWQKPENLPPIRYAIIHQDSRIACVRCFGGAYRDASQKGPNGEVAPFL
ncbi:hypothetical protein LJR235_002027 [Pararhizobium sp. LjRoot235]|uniref:hypothetical protein n=1 Tax=Pararhizobium sp. LjRoot235 TaxID=3342291 RepID=UPI003ECCFC43